ncbi:Flagellin [Pandoraea communis]|uniref:Flagellin n=1 Tax=Pandoraea communis TaxID=2508297 RepID=A0A5E4TEA6_9BURK|nr:flagellin [Pandoraea communis]VVD84459.1 Flagellin [Pandoraea communis]
MSSVINTNIFSLVAQRNLSTSQSGLQTSITRLSSGLRINSAADDAAGLAITDRMTAQINGTQQAQRNANDGISLVQTAAGALSAVTDNLNRIRTLAVQSTNSTNSTSDRSALDQEVQQRLAEINRLSAQTQYNGQNILDGSFGTATFQVGANSGQTISVGLTQGVQTSSLGAVASKTLTTTAAAGGFKSFTVAALTVTVGGGSAINVAAGTYNTASDLATAINAAAGSNVVSVNKTTGELTTAAYANVTFGGADGTTLGLANVTATGAAADSTAVSTNVGLSLAAGDLTLNSGSTTTDITGYFSTTQDLADAINAKNISGLTAVVDKGGNVALNSQKQFSITGTATKLGATNAGVSAVGGSLQNADVLTVDSATKMIQQIDSAINTVDSLQSTLGAVQNRFQSTISSLSTTSQNLTTARSGVQDTDYAAETANLSKSQILQQAGISMLAQANQLPQQVLKLLQ